MPRKDKQLKTEYMKEYRKRRKELGLCLSCKGKKAVNGETYCINCKRKAIRRKARRIYDKGKCAYCTNKAIQGKTRCKRCTELYNEYNRNNYKSLRESGVCVQCRRNKVKEGRARCKGCLATASKTQQRYRIRLKEREELETSGKVKES